MFCKSSSNVITIHLVASYDSCAVLRRNIRVLYQKMQKIIKNVQSQLGYVQSQS